LKLLSFSFFSLLPNCYFSSN